MARSMICRKQSGVWGTERVDFLNTSDSEFIPKALELPFIVGAIGILYGEK